MHAPRTGDCRLVERDGPFRPPCEKAALCGLHLDGSGALLVQDPISCSVGGGSEKSVSDARSVNASAAPSRFMSRSLFRVASNGKVIEEYTNWDMFGMMQQLGAVAELAHA